MALVWSVTLMMVLPGVGVSGLASTQSQVIGPRWSHHPVDGERDAPVWTWWLGAGAGARQLRLSAGSVRPDAELRAGLGFELTSVDVSPYHQLQVGPWIEATGDLAGALGEGGLELGLTKEVYDGSFYGLRAGGGYGVGPSDRGAAIIGTLLFGRRHTWGKCAYLYRARGWRAFATVRYWPAEGRGLNVVAGLEIDPSLLFPDEADDFWDQLNHHGESRCVHLL